MCAKEKNRKSYAKQKNIRLCTSVMFHVYRSELHTGIKEGFSALKMHLFILPLLFTDEAF